MLDTPLGHFSQRALGYAASRVNQGYSTPIRVRPPNQGPHRRDEQRMILVGGYPTPYPPTSYSDRLEIKAIAER